MKIVLAGGGTAGHIEPALAVARTWRANHPGDQIEFLPLLDLNFRISLRS
jgi:UDP-N-acetylglucosamine--N-acetylmuramyl-(pentapeptide) pyrophosphoryl-undecaprenol N-acetylglucosamine transferase